MNFATGWEKAIYWRLEMARWRSLANWKRLHRGSLADPGREATFGAVFVLYLILEP
jgi:hypothetical protein